MKRVVVLMATYNGEKYVEEQINSILRQKNVRVQLIIRDDGSSDDTLNICKTAASQDNRIHILRSGDPTGTPSGNFFKIIDWLGNSNNIDYDYIAFADQDDIWLRDKLIAAIDKMGETHFAYSSNLIAFTEGGKRSWIVDKSGPQTDIDYIFQGASAGCTYVLKKEVLVDILKMMKTIEFKDLKLLSHDWLVYAIVRSAQRSWVMDAAAYIFYRQHISNNYGDKKGLQLLAFKLSLIRSGWYFKSVRKIYALVSLNSNTSRLKRLLQGDNAFRYFDMHLLLKSRRSLKESFMVLGFYLFSFN